MKKAVTRRQYDTYMALWQRTGGGATAWAGVLEIDGTLLSRTHEVLNALRHHGLVTWRRLHNAREFRCLVHPDTLSLHYRHPSGKSTEQRHEQRLRDDGRFLEAARKARLPLFEDEPNLKSALAPYIPPRHRPDARVLDVVRAPHAA